MRLGYRGGSPYREKFLSSFLLLQFDTTCSSKNEIVGSQYSSAKYIVMLRGRSILFQATKRMRNSLIHPAVRYSIYDKRDPQLIIYSFDMYDRVSYIIYHTFIFNTQKLCLRCMKQGNCDRTTRLININWNGILRMFVLC